MLDKALKEHLVDRGNSQIKPGLERMQIALARLNYPQLQYQVIHIAGTNGKGSVAAFIEAGLIDSGYKVGAFTSPYIWQINESIRINGENIGDEALTDSFLKVTEQVVDIGLSPFELLTVIMFYHLAMLGIDYLVLECGMGGANDCTNVVAAKYVVITNVGLDHTRYLGKTIAKIAREKAGIIKSGSYVVTADKKKDVLLAINDKVANFTNILTKYNHEIVTVLKSTKKQIISTKMIIEGREYSLNMLGGFQIYNFLCAYDILAKIGVSEASIAYAAANAYMPYRMEVVAKKPLTIFDIAHNVGAIRVLSVFLSKRFSPQHVVIIANFMKDKKIDLILKILSKIGDVLIIPEINVPSRASLAKEVAAIAKLQFKQVRIAKNLKSALKMARANDPEMIIATGSSYLFHE